MDAKVIPCLFYAFSSISELKEDHESPEIPQNSSEIPPKLPEKQISYTEKFFKRLHTRKDRFLKAYFHHIISYLSPDSAILSDYKKLKESGKYDANFGRKFRRKVLKIPGMREEHYHRVECIAGLGINAKGELLPAKCCKRREHSDKCEKQWEKLMEYLRVEVVREVGLEPFPGYVA